MGERLQQTGGVYRKLLTGKKKSAALTVAQQMCESADQRANSNADAAQTRQTTKIKDARWAMGPERADNHLTE